jgi:hypothetical protein
MAEVTLYPTADTFVYEGTPTSNSGSGTTINLAGLADYRQRGLIRFDLSELDGAEITSAKLTLTTVQSWQWDPVTVYIHRILAANSAWTEAGATWNYAVSSSTRWAGDSGNNGGPDAGCTQSGTDYSATAIGSYIIAANEAAGTQHEVTLNASEFASMVANNAGVVLFAEDNVQIASRNHGTAGYRPKLVVEYEAGEPESGLIPHVMYYARMRGAA